MINDFDYIKHVSEEAYLEPDVDDEDVINECDLALCEFDSYVQEGVATKILIGVGIAAALGGLIALIVHICKKNSDKGAKKQAKKTKDNAKKAENVPNADEKLQDTKGAKTGATKTRKGIGGLFHSMGSSVSKLRRKFTGKDSAEPVQKQQVVQNSALVEVPSDIYFYNEALTPSHTGIKAYEAALEFIESKTPAYMNALEDVVSAAIDTYESRPGGDDTIQNVKNAIRSKLIKLDEVEQEIMKYAVDSGFWNFETSGVTKEILNEITVREIITLCELVERAFDEFGKEMKALKKLQSRCNKYTNSAQTMNEKRFGRFLDTYISPMILNLTKGLTESSVNLTAALQEFDMACYDIMGNVEPTTAKDVAFKDLGDTISRKAQKVY